MSSVHWIFLPLSVFLSFSLRVSVTPSLAASSVRVAVAELLLLLAAITPWLGMAGGQSAIGDIIKDISAN